MDKKIAIIGNQNTILGFKAIGAKALAVTEKEDVIKHLEDIKNSDEFGIVFITEDWQEQVIKEIDELFGTDALPAIVAIPSQRGSTGAGLRNLSKIVEQAIGSDILG